MACVKYISHLPQMPKHGDNTGRFTNGPKAACRKMKLDIGCGANKKTGYIGMDIVPKWGIDVIGDAQILPFHDNSFDEIQANFVIEHLIHPDKFITETVRCSQNSVIIRTDNMFCWGYLLLALFAKGRASHKEHCFGWTRATFKTLMNKLGYRGHIRLETNAQYWSPLWHVRLFYKAEQIISKIPLPIFQRDIVVYLRKKDQ